MCKYTHIYIYITICAIWSIPEAVPIGAGQPIGACQVPIGACQVPIGACQVPIGAGQVPIGVGSVLP